MTRLRQISVQFWRDQNGSEGDHVCEDMETALLRSLRNVIGVKDFTIDLAWPQSVYSVSDTDMPFKITRTSLDPP